MAEAFPTGWRPPPDEYDVWCIDMLAMRWRAFEYCKYWYASLPLVSPAVSLMCWSGTHYLASMGRSGVARQHIEEQFHAAVHRSSKVRNCTTNVPPPALIPVTSWVKC